MTDANAQKTIVTLATATPGGGFPVYGDALRRTRQRDRSDARRRAAQHQGQRPRTFRCSRPASSTSRWCRAKPAYEALAGIGRAPANLKIVAAMYSIARHVRGARRQPGTAPSRDLKGKPVAFGAHGLGPRDPGALRARRARPRPGQGFPGDLPRARRRRSGHGARRPRGGAVGRRHRLAGLHRGGASAGRRALHRAERRRDRAHPRQASFLKRVTIPAGSYPTAERADSLRSARGASCWRARRSPTTSPIGSRARCIAARPRSRQKLAPGARDHRREHRRRRRRTRDLHPSRRAKYLREIGALR